MPRIQILSTYYRTWRSEKGGGNGSSRRADLYNQIKETKEDKYQKYAEEELEKNKKEEPKWGDSG